MFRILSSWLQFGFNMFQDAYISTSFRLLQPLCCYHVSTRYQFRVLYCERIMHVAKEKHKMGCHKDGWVVSIQEKKKKKKDKWVAGNDIVYVITCLNS